MIGMSYADALFAFFVLWLIFIGILWWREPYRAKRFSWKLSNSTLFHCDSRHHSFIIKESVNLTRCPRCNSICICRKRRDLE